jgi:hypothetical protein
VLGETRSTREGQSLVAPSDVRLRRWFGRQRPEDRLFVVLLALVLLGLIAVASSQWAWGSTSQPVQIRNIDGPPPAPTVPSQRPPLALPVMHALSASPPELSPTSPSSAPLPAASPAPAAVSAQPVTDPSRSSARRPTAPAAKVLTPAPAASQSPTNPTAPPPPIADAPTARGVRPEPPTTGDPEQQSESNSDN